MLINMMTFLRRCLNGYTAKIQQCQMGNITKGISVPEFTNAEAELGKTFQSDVGGLLASSQIRWSYRSNRCMVEATHLGNCMELNFTDLFLEVCVFSNNEDQIWVLKKDMKGMTVVRKEALALETTVEV
ncbi:hypothetical protein R1flu_003242 [Riccia fluitans]|uniref:Uncharacterized protein n=1 Tax=Riccia fluitans TaxID=41844 RepID=A0ABD1Y8E8_9MARC